MDDGKWLNRFWSKYTILTTHLYTCVWGLFWFGPCSHEYVCHDAKTDAWVCVWHWSNVPSPMSWIESQENTLWVLKAALDCLFPERTGFPDLAALLTGTLGSEVTEFWTEALSSVSETIPFAEGTVLSTMEWGYLAFGLPVDLPGDLPFPCFCCWGWAPPLLSRGSLLTGCPVMVHSLAKATLPAPCWAGSLLTLTVVVLAISITLLGLASFASRWYPQSWLGLPCTPWIQHLWPRLDLHRMVCHCHHSLSWTWHTPCQHILDAWSLLSVSPT